MNMNYEKGGGLVPVIVQHFTTGEVLMLGYGHAESMRLCAETGELWLFSRSRAKLWKKGETSGNTQRIVSITSHCDEDAVLVRVRPSGPVCHTGARACFDDAPTLRALASVIEQRATETASQGEAAASYTARLLGDENLRLK